MTETPEQVQELTENPLFDLPAEEKLDLELFAAAASGAVYEAIQNASNSTDRSKQQQDHYIGISTLGHCKNYAALMMKQTPFSDDRDKTAAFFGTVAGDAIEQQLRIDHPGWLIQHRGEFPIPSGGLIPGTSDIIIPFDESVTVEDFESRARFAKARAAGEVEGPEQEPAFVQGVWDLKSKAELETIKKYGPNRQQIMQVHAYAKAAIKEGILNPDYPILVCDVFFDRSGRDQMPHTVFHLYNEDVITMIDEWINDVKYAVLNGEDAEREMPREWCWSYCEYATVCRGNDTDVEGLLEDPELLAATELYAGYSKTKTDAEKAMKKLKPIFEDRLGSGGSTGLHNVRWIDVNETFIEGYTRSGYRKLDIRPVPGPKKPKTRKKVASGEG